ncbi:MAG: divergent polysaccharide deacetylase family protein [Pseudorhodoplanes sp.]|uniref:divergent polysaccharide deacetylase family protein n=1 Tax=Pseudorhodoplanes sp. TaxID=1934341 RepID=UPI003D0B3BAB
MDDLNAPLGQGAAPQRRFPIARLAAQGLASILGAALVGFLLWAALMRDPLGGEPTAAALIPPAQTAQAPAAQPEPRLDQPAPGTPADGGVTTGGSQTITIIDGSSGKRQEVVIASSEGKRGTGDARALEPSRHGPIPRIASDGRRPSEIYARKPDAGTRNPDGPRIAIVVGGLGVSATTTANALSKLPGAITFAFTPYGADLDTHVSQAREKGHEVLLQVPMEPYDYPDNDPGPQTLLSSLSSEQNVDRLHWLFSRIQGYVGVMNFMGARFTASDNALAPVLRELSKRGLIYVDDGTSPRSQAGQIAGANKLPYAKAEVVIDAVPSAAEIDSALKRLETLARGRGVVVGYSSALPASIDRIAKWAKAAQGRGIVLIPVTAAAVRARST